MTDFRRRQFVAQSFESIFGEPPLLWTRAPGRIDLMGSHTDYNLGHVLTLPISLDVWIAARPRDDGQVRIHSLDLDSISCFALNAIEHDEEQPWSNYIRGVAATLKYSGLTVRGFDGVIQSTVPMGSGLASSAALECATGILFGALGHWTLSPVDMALRCQQAEHEFAGVKCGILDQYTSCLGRGGCALLLDCRDLTHRTLPVPPSIRVIVCDTRSPRKLAGSEYGARRAQCEEGARRLGVATLREVTLERLEFVHDLPAEVFRRCRFIIEEDLRVLQMAETLAAGDVTTLARLCAESFRGARELYEICSPAMDEMMKAMLAGPGILGARQAGAGFGGCMVALVDAGSVEAFEAAVCDLYKKATGVTPNVHSVEAAPGAMILNESASLPGEQEWCPEQLMEQSD